MIPKPGIVIGLLIVVIASLIGLGCWFFYLAFVSVEMGSYIAVGYLVVGVAFFLLTSIIAAFPLSRAFSMPFGSLFFPEARFDRPQPPYSRAEAALKRGDPQGAIALYRELAETYPEEVQPYIGMMNIAAHDLGDRELTKKFYRMGMRLLEDMESQKVLNKMYRANMSRLAEPPVWGEGKTVHFDGESRD